MKVLVVVPHADDEVACCGGTIAKLVSQGHQVDLVVAGLGWGNSHVRVKELEFAVTILGIHEYQVLFPLQESYLDTIPQTEFVGRLDGISSRGYDEVYYPCPGHHHHDHRAVHDACHAAFRLGRIKSPTFIGMYEYVYPGWMEFSQPFGKLYYDITGKMDIKVAAMKCYNSQYNRHPETHPINPQSLVKLASARGLEAGCQFAELFYVAREIR